VVQDREGAGDRSDHYRAMVRPGDIDFDWNDQWVGQRRALILQIEKVRHGDGDDHPCRVARPVRV